MMTAIAFGVLLVFRIGAEEGIRDDSADFPRARPKIKAEVTGRLTESLGGVRVIKGYHAEEREEGVFAGGVQRLLDNVLKYADGDFADEAFLDRADGDGRRADDVLRRAADSARAR